MKFVDNTVEADNKYMGTKFQKDHTAWLGQQMNLRKKYKEVNINFNTGI